jgi:hypothetical protein
MASDHQLQLAIRELRDAQELRVPRRRALLLVDQRRGRREAGERHVGRRVRRHRHRVDRHVEAAALQLAGGAQAGRAAANHRGTAPLGLQRELGRHHAASHAIDMPAPACP